MCNLLRASWEIFSLDPPPHTHKKKRQSKLTVPENSFSRFKTLAAGQLMAIQLLPHHKDTKIAITEVIYMDQLEMLNIFGKIKVAISYRVTK